MMESERCLKCDLPESLQDQYGDKVPGSAVCAYCSSKLKGRRLSERVEEAIRPVVERSALGKHVSLDRIIDDLRDLEKGYARLARWVCMPHTFLN